MSVKNITKLYNACESFDKLAQEVNLGLPLGGKLQSIPVNNLPDMVELPAFRHPAEETKQEWEARTKDLGPVVPSNEQAKETKQEWEARTKNLGPVVPSKEQAAQSKFPHINPVFQTMLNVNPDSSLGPQTRAALEVYKKSKNMPGMSDSLAFRYLEAEPEYAQKKGMEFDDNANVYVSKYKATAQTAVDEMFKLADKLNSKLG